MVMFIIIVAIVMLIGFSMKKNDEKASQTNAHVRTPKDYSKIVKVEITKSPMSKSPVSKVSSIIDVTGQSVRINSADLNPVLKTYTKGVPYWQHQYVYSYSEINYATAEQRAFYELLKHYFLKGEYIDLQGNLNYAFILFFNLLDDFVVHKDLNKIKNQLDILAIIYPKTGSYARQELAKRLDNSLISELDDLQTRGYYSNNYESFKLGSKYKTKLKLSDSQSKLLNRIWQPSNNFGNIEYCCDEIVKLFLKTIDGLERKLQSENSSLEKELDFLADLVARKHFNYRNNSSNYKYSIEQSKDQLYSTIFKVCENTVRERFEHRRRLPIEFYTNYPVIHQEFENRIVSRISPLHNDLISSIPMPDESTEIELNSQNTSRWKGQFEKICSDFNGDTQKFAKAIEGLGAKNIKNPALENIYFDASKFVAKTDKQLALILYIHYVYCDLQSTKFDNKQLTKTVQKSLFATPEHVLEFEKIISDLVNTRNLKVALEVATQFYAPKRKKIKLSKDAIKDAHQQHSVTVELLNEYLNEDQEEAFGNAQNKEELKMAISKPVIESSPELVDTPSKFTDTQREFLDFFQKNGLALTAHEVDSFAKGKNLFKNQLVESINDTCFETLDDILIEEDGETYSINENYFKRILSL